MVILMLTFVCISEQWHPTVFKNYVGHITIFPLLCFLELKIKEELCKEQGVSEYAIG